MTRSGFRPAASADVEAAYEWYEAQRPGLGDEFIVAVDAAVASILAFPDAYPVVHLIAAPVESCSNAYRTASTTVSRARGFSLSLACTLPAIQGGGVRALTANTLIPR